MFDFYVEEVLVVFVIYFKKFFIWIVVGGGWEVGEMEIILCFLVVDGVIGWSWIDCVGCVDVEEFLVGIIGDVCFVVGLNFV